MKTRTAALAALLWIGSPGAQEIDPDGFPAQGFIRNAVNDRCSYVQTYEKTNPHFHPSSPHMKNQNLRTITFDDPQCMADVIDGLDAAGIVNKSMIAQVIARWLTRANAPMDSAYDARRRREPGSFLQEFGECMMAPGYPATAVAIDFSYEEASIIEVFYAPIFGCGEAL